MQDEIASRQLELHIMQHGDSSQQSVQEHTGFKYHRKLDVVTLEAFHLQYAYPKHSHDHFVIALIERGLQSFTLKGTKYITPPLGLILINPGVIHTGEAAADCGFKLLSIYPKQAHFVDLRCEFGGQKQALAYFKEIRVDRPETTRLLLTLHQALAQEHDSLTRDSFFRTAMVHLVEHYGEFRPKPIPLGNERNAVRLARDYIEANYARQISLNELATQVALSPYYLLRVFKNEVGLPPHAYLHDVRIRRAQQLIDAGQPLVDVATAVGFSSQSHLTRRFKQIVGLTPGRYAAQMHSAQ